jgi:hypothetical protein
MAPTALAELARNAEELRTVFPDSDVRLRSGALSWTCDLQPTDISRVYRVSLSYDAKRFPRVQVLRPPLEPNEKGELPHYYPDGYLCLHRPEEWFHDPLVDTIVPWTCEWLLHYEIWKATKRWQGSGGNHVIEVPQAIYQDATPSRPRGRPREGQARRNTGRQR